MAPAAKKVPTLRFTLGGCIKRRTGSLSVPVIYPRNIRLAKIEDNQIHSSEKEKTRNVRAGQGVYPVAAFRGP